MSKNRIIAGIELGSSKITTLISQLQTENDIEGGGISISGVSSIPSSGIKKGQIVNIEETVEATVSSIEAAERMAGYSVDRAYIALSGASVISQNSHGVVAVSDTEGEINTLDVDRVIEAASAVSTPSSREIIHVLPREYAVDGEKGVRDPIGMSGVRLEVETHIITASSSSIKNIKKAVNEVGISIEDLVFSGLAASDSTLTETEKELGCVLVDIGGGTTSIAAFMEGSITYSGVIPIGAKNVTNDLAIGLRVSLETAEKIKLSLSEYGKKESNKKEETSDILDLEEEGIKEIKKVSKKTLIEGIIRPRLNEIFTMVRLELEKVGIADSIPSGAIICGGGAKTIGVYESAKRMLSLPVRLGVPRGVGGLIDDLIDPAYSVPVGLLIYGARHGVEERSVSKGFAKKLKLPTKGLAGKIFETIRDLLP